MPDQLFQRNKWLLIITMTLVLAELTSLFRVGRNINRLERERRSRRTSSDIKLTREIPEEVSPTGVVEDVKVSEDPLPA